MVDDGGIERVLTPDSAAVYRVVAGQSGLTVPEVAEVTGLSEDTVHRVVAHLREVHLVRPMADDEDRLVAVSPEVASRRTLAVLEEEAARQARQIAHTQAQFTSLVSDYETARSEQAPAGAIEFVAGVENVRALLADLGETAARRAWSLNPGNKVSEEGLEAALPVDAAALARGVDVRSLFQHTVLTHVPTMRYIKEISVLGAHVRTVARVPTRMLLVDDRLVVPAAEDGVPGAMSFDEPRVAAVGEMMFRHLWDTAIPFESDLGTDEESPNDLEIAVLRGLASGRKDETIARDLGVSVRTMRRHVAMLMTRLEADTRFQAGASAVRRGWL